MISIALNLPPPSPPPDCPSDERAWFDRVAQCTLSMAKTLETRAVQATEIPIVIGSLIVALADHQDRELEAVIELCARAARLLKTATPETQPEGMPS